MTDTAKKETSVLRIYVTIFCVSCIQGLQFSPSPVLSLIQDHFSDVPVSMTQMLITGPSLVAMVFAILSGLLVTKISKKRQLLIAALLTGITGVVPFLVDSFPLLFAMRLLYGVSLGLCVALNTAIVAEWFEGKQRVTAMGLQSAFIGISIALISAIAGKLGQSDFRYSYLINLAAFGFFVLILFVLPETGTVQITSSNKIKINAHVVVVASLGLLEFLFLISFSTNIAMHLAGPLAGDSATAGILTGAFSVGMILIGFVLTPIMNIFHNFTLAFSMLMFTVGAVFLILFPGNFAGLMIGAVLCGISQGIFVPTGFVVVSNMVPPAASAVAAGFQTSGQCIGQLLSPLVLNTAATGILGSASTGNVYIVAAVGMAMAAVYAAIVVNVMNKEKKS